jgi:hypothetical protein
MIRRTSVINYILSSSNYGIDASPNPFLNNFQLSYQIPVNQHIQISLTDISGQLIKILVSTYKEAGNYSMNINEADLHPGIYIIKLVTAKGQVKTSMIVKQ